MPFVRGKGARETLIMYNDDVGLRLEAQMNPVGIRIDKQVVYNVQEVQGYDFNIYRWTSGGVKSLGFDMSFDSRPYEITDMQKFLNVAGRGLDFGQRVIRTYAQDQITNLVPGASLVQSGVGILAGPIRKLGGRSVPTDAKELAAAFNYLTIDGKPYNPDEGLLKTIAIINSFKQPRATLQGKPDNIIGNVGADGSQLSDLNPDNTFASPPDCYVKWGTRVFRCKLMAAPIQEVIHNWKGVPERIDVSFEFNVIETGDLAVKNTQDRYELAYDIGGESEGQGSEFVAGL